MLLCQESCMALKLRLVSAQWKRYEHRTWDNFLQKPFPAALDALGMGRRLSPGRFTPAHVRAATHCSKFGPTTTPSGAERNVLRYNPRPERSCCAGAVSLRAHRPAHHYACAAHSPAPLLGSRFSCSHCACAARTWRKRRTGLCWSRLPMGVRLSVRRGLWKTDQRYGWLGEGGWRFEVLVRHHPSRPEGRS